MEKCISKNRILERGYAEEPSPSISYEEEIFIDKMINEKLKEKIEK